MCMYTHDITGSVSGPKVSPRVSVPELSVGSGTQTDILAASPVPTVVDALTAGRGKIGHLVSGMI